MRLCDRAWLLSVVGSTCCKGWPCREVSRTIVPTFRADARIAPGVLRQVHQKRGSNSQGASLLLHGRHAARNVPRHADSLAPNCLARAQRQITNNFAKTTNTAQMECTNSCSLGYASPRNQAQDADFRNRSTFDVIHPMSRSSLSRSSRCGARDAMTVSRRRTIRVRALAPHVGSEFSRAARCGLPFSIGKYACPFRHPQPPRNPRRLNLFHPLVSRNLSPMCVSMIV